LLIYSGCAKNFVKKESDEEILKTRATAYWNHKVRGEFDRSYEFEDPFFRKNVNLNRYIQSIPAGRITWQGAGVERITVYGERADIDIKLAIKIIVSSKKNIEQDVKITDKWVKVDGIWYHVHEKGGGNPGSN
jgi:hypothetical protein